GPRHRRPGGRLPALRHFVRDLERLLPPARHVDRVEHHAAVIDPHPGIAHQPCPAGQIDDEVERAGRHAAVVADGAHEGGGVADPHRIVEVGEREPQARLRR
ncbi:MAG: hypothetical protein ACK55I_20920, partial [bacterium]